MLRPRNTSRCVHGPRARKAWGALDPCGKEGQAEAQAQPCYSPATALLQLCYRHRHRHSLSQKCTFGLGWAGRLGWAGWAGPAGLGWALS